MKTLILYSTLGCHLCEQAKELIWPVLSAEGFTLREIDIADSEELMARYGTSIPVLENSATAQQLYWPFDSAAVTALLQSSS